MCVFTYFRIIFYLVFLFSDYNCDPVVNTDCGPVEGFESDGVYNFYGIPYATPPVGRLRWRPPEMLSPNAGNCWSGTLSAKKYGNTCYQISPDDHKTLLGSEDCLYLNVITPSLDVDAKKHVMVWIHGGSLQFSNGNWPLYSPTSNLSRDTDIVYVGFNYRLHAFGFMALQMLADDSTTKISGNYGFMDMIAVLQWVKTNIQQFGGDPNKVTVFGQSSGGTAIFALLASPLCQGLFNKAWLLSASPILNKTADEAFRDNEVFLKNTNCTDITCLYSLTSEEVTLSVPWNTYPNWAMLDQGDLPIKGQFDGAIAIVDGYVLKQSPFDAWQNEQMVDVPLLIGTTANEIDYNPLYMDLYKWTWDDYDKHVHQNLGTFGKNVLQDALKFYPLYSITPEFQFTSMASDIRVNCPNDILSIQAANTFKSPVYRYVATYSPSVPVNPVGIPFPARYSFHMIDVFAFFGFMPDYIDHPTLRDIEWQRNVQNEVLSFVREGKPSSIYWGVYPKVTASLSFETQALEAYNPVQCEFWLTNGFFDYAWIN